MVNQTLTRALYSSRSPRASGRSHGSAERSGAGTAPRPPGLSRAVSRTVSRQKEGGREEWVIQAPSPSLRASPGWQGAGALGGAAREPPGCPVRTARMGERAAREGAAEGGREDGAPVLTSWSFRFRTPQSCAGAGTQNRTHARPDDPLIAIQAVGRRPSSRPREASGALLADPDI